MLSSLEHLWSKSDNVIYFISIGQNHNQAVDAQSDPGALGHGWQDLQKFFRHGVWCPIFRGADFQRILKTTALFVSVGQFRKAIGQFQSADVELEAFRNSWITHFYFSQ